MSEVTSPEPVDARSLVSERHLSMKPLQVYPWREFKVRYPLGRQRAIGTSQEFFPVDLYVGVKRKNAEPFPIDPTMNEAVLRAIIAGTDGSLEYLAPIAVSKEPNRGVAMAVALEHGEPLQEIDDHVLARQAVLQIVNTIGRLHALGITLNDMKTGDWFVQEGRTDEDPPRVHLVDLGQASTHFLPAPERALQSLADFAVTARNRQFGLSNLLSQLGYFDDEIDKMLRSKKSQWASLFTNALDPDVLRRSIAEYGIDVPEVPSESDWQQMLLRIRQMRGWARDLSVDTLESVWRSTLTTMGFSVRGSDGAPDGLLIDRAHLGIPCITGYTDVATLLAREPDPFTAARQELQRVCANVKVPALTDLARLRRTLASAQRLHTTYRVNDLLKLWWVVVEQHTVFGVGPRSKQTVSEDVVRAVVRDIGSYVPLSDGQKKLLGAFQRSEGDIADDTIDKISISSSEMYRDLFDVLSNIGKAWAYQS